MPADAARASSEARAVAPDGIAIHTFDLGPAAFVGIAEGRIPPGRYAAHLHLSLEQFTYVVEGQLRVITGGVTTEAGPGDLLLTLPGESLQFINDGAQTARVLFICAPPYPPDDSDTRTLSANGPLGPEHAQAAIERMKAVRAAFNAVVDARIAELRSVTE